MKLPIRAATTAKWAATVAALALAAVATAGEEMHAQFAIAVESDDGVTLDLDSEDLGFNLHDLQEGETRSIVDESGRNILITRTAEGFTFNVDGKSIDLPMMGDAHSMAFVEGDPDVDFDVRVLHADSSAVIEEMDGVTIISGEAIDESTRESIRSALISAGHDGDVQFIDKAGAHGMRQVKVIRKDVEITH